MKVFVVYWHDRHCDAAITVHATRQSADDGIETHKSLYDKDRYRWTEHNYGREQGWVRYVSGGEEGPNGRILEREVLP